MADDFIQRNSSAECPVLVVSFATRRGFTSLLRQPSFGNIDQSPDLAGTGKDPFHQRLPLIPKLWSMKSPPGLAIPILRIRSVAFLAV